VKVPAVLEMLARWKEEHAWEVKRAGQRCSLCGGSSENGEHEVGLIWSGQAPNRSKRPVCCMELGMHVLTACRRRRVGQALPHTPTSLLSLGLWLSGRLEVGLSATAGSPRVF
jgi:hypothetical protein